MGEWVKGWRVVAYFCSWTFHVVTPSCIPPINYWPNHLPLSFKALI